MGANAIEGGYRLSPKSETQVPAVVTVITVTLNAVNGLAETIRSVRAQGWDGIEHVVIDGGSADGTAELLKARDHEIAYWRSAPDAGIYDAMNTGLVFARGDYVLFLNSGDILCGSVLGPNQDFNRLLTVKRLNLLGRSQFVKLRDMTLGMPYCHQGMLFRNRALKPFDPRFRIAADYKFLLDNLGNAGLFVPDDRNSGHVVFDSTGISSTRILERDLESARIIQDRFGRWHWIRFWCRQLPKFVVRLLLRWGKAFSGRQRRTVESGEGS